MGGLQNDFRGKSYRIWQKDKPAQLAIAYHTAVTRRRKMRAYLPNRAFASRESLAGRDGRRPVRGTREEKLGAGRTEGSEVGEEARKNHRSSWKKETSIVSEPRCVAVRGHKIGEDQWPRQGRSFRFW